MKTKLLLKLTALLILFISFHANSQFVDNENDTKWNVGFNMGAVWQDGDVKLRTPGFGYGFTLGKGVYEAPNHFWSFDIRFRYLKGRTYGQDFELSDVTGNPIYSDSNTNYIAAYSGTPLAGKSYLNNKTDIHDFNLEGVANLYWLRKHTGVLISVFGGIGITDYRTRTDLTNLDNFDKIYNYIPLNNPTIDEIRFIQDKEYESFANFNETQQIKFMPSLGIGLGYQVTPQLSIGFEHRVTFTLADKFDGVEKEGTEFLQWGNNDKYHYSSINFRWNIFKNNNTSSKYKKDCVPYVKIAKPRYTTVNTKLIELKTRVSKIQSNYDVILYLNDSTVPTVYNTSTDYVTGNLELKEGENFIYFYASNECGENADSLIINYNPTYCPKPTINITSPASNLEVDKALLKANVSHIENATIEVKLNNQVIAYNLNSTKDLLTASLNLVKNTNNISVKATNSCGVTIVNKQVIYKEKPCFPPLVTISSPIDGRVYKNNSINFVATSTNITNSSQVQVFVNGKKVNSNYNNSNKKITISNANLQKGINSIQVSVQNKCGQDSKTVSFTYCEDPKVSISSPSNGTNNTSGFVNLSGNTTNITNKNQIQVTVNGVNKTFNYNSSKNTFTSGITLSAGNNTITVTANNTCGNDSKTITVNYNKPCPTPSVVISTPVNNSSNSTGMTIVTGNVSNITSKNQLQISVNGVNKSFSYNSSTRIFSTSVNLTAGNNTISVTATNNCGNNNQSVFVNYVKSCPTPVVFISSPANGSNTSNNTTVVTGTVANISSKSQLQLKLNGTNKAFNFNTSTRVFTATVSLIQGNNSINVVATNNCGSDNKTVNINHSQNCPKPIVSILSPLNNNIISKGGSKISGTALNVVSNSQLSVKVNGVSRSVSFNSSTKIFTADANFVSGNNMVSVIATTSCGTSSKTSSIVYRCSSPSINITSPNTGMNYPMSSISMTGITSGITTKNQITLTLNGNNVAFNFDTRTSKITANLSLVEGQNTITSTVTNTCGTATKTSTVGYVKPCPKPIVNITMNGSTIYTDNINITGSVINATKIQTKVSVNGTSIPFTLSSSGIISTSYGLNQGNNTIVISATTNCGTSTKTLNVNYVPCTTPKVTIISPTAGSSFSTSSTIGQANLFHVNTKSQLTVKLNGVLIPFTLSSNRVTANLNLREGTNIFYVKANSNCGSSEKTVSFVYKKPCVPPTVNILSPVSGKIYNTKNIAASVILTNISSKSQVTVKLNGNTIPFNLSGNNLTANLNLAVGGNVLIVTANSGCGNDQKIADFTYTVPCYPPLVSVTTPINGFTTTLPTIIVSGIATNLINQSDMEITLNGVNKNFSYNSSTRKYTATISLKNGINTIVVNANTNCGSDSKTIKVTYNQIIKPLVTVYLPTLDSTNTVATQIKTGGIVELVTDRTKFSIKVNGVNYTGFTFVSKGTNKFEFAGLLGLNPGLNIITFTGTHSSGGIHVVTKKVVLPSTQLLTPNNNPIPNKGNKNKQTPNNGSLKVR